MQGLTDSAARTGKGGFTLIELMTVVAILSILVGLTVAGLQAWGDKAAYDATASTLRAVNAGLRHYAEDYGGLFPWPSDDLTHNMGGVDWDAVTGGAQPGGEHREEIALYGALTARRRRGPYFGAGSDVTALVEVGTDKYTVIVDGWKRPLRYEAPGDDDPLPIVTSAGRDAEFGTDDDITAFSETMMDEAPEED